MIQVVIIAIIIVLLVIALFLLYFLIRKSRDEIWWDANGDYTMARSATGGNTPRDRVRTGGIYLRTFLENEEINRTPRDNEAALNIVVENFMAALNDDTVGLPLIMTIDNYANDLHNYGIVLNTTPIHDDARTTVKRQLLANEISRDEYFDAVQEWQPDPENVHDNKLVKDLKNTLRRAKELSPPMDTYTAFQSARDAIYDSDLANSRKASALNALEVIAKSEYNSTYGGNENDIFAAIWTRACDASPNAQESVLLSLADCERSRGQFVCSTGRMSRIIDALNMTDPEFANSPAMTAKAYKDQIFAEVQKELRSAIDNARENGKTTVAGVYDGTIINYDDTNPELLEFKNDMSGKIDDIVDSYANIFTKHELETIRADCKIAL